MLQNESSDQDWAPVWLDRVRRRVRQWCASGAGTTWVVAVSGGGDSVALVRALHLIAPEQGLILSVAHLDHGARGEAAKADAAFVHDLADSLGLPIDLGTWQSTRSAHFEADARRARYAWLLGVATARGASAIAVGHTCDDQAETILHRIIRGTGLRGLAGMPARRVLSHDPPVMLVRPLLSVSRQAIRSSLQSAGQEFREDASNDDLTRTRARIRHDLLPRLAREYNPRVAESIVRLSALAGASDRIIQERVSDLAADVIRSISTNEATLHGDRLAPISPFLRAEVLRRIWRLVGWPEAGMSAWHWRRLASLAGRRRKSRTSVGGGVEALTTIDKDTLSTRFVLRRIETRGSSQRRPAAPEA